MAESRDMIQNVTNRVENISVKAENNVNTSVDHNSTVNEVNNSEKWGFPLKDLYKLGLKFYKDKEGKAVNLSYQNKLRLVAFSQQVSHGPFNLDKSPPLGVLDVIGRDRRDAWQSLGDMSKETAMVNFIELLDTSCPSFKPFVEAQKTDLEEKAKLALLEEERRKEEILKEFEKQKELQKAEEEREAAEQRKRQIQDALNEQTFHQFKAYAEEQYPGNPEQQAVLVRQLQEQHYHQYMQQLMQQQHQAVQTVNSQADMESSEVNPNDSLDNGVEESDDGLPRISPPSMWTRKDIKDFKESIRKEGGDAIIKVGHGETVTVRVPTHEDGTCLFWEFATDSYDIGFGVYFEWTKSPTNQVSVHIQDSEDEEDDLEDDDELDEDEAWNILQSTPSQFETVSLWLLDPICSHTDLIPDLYLQTVSSKPEFADFAEGNDIEKGSKAHKLAESSKDKPLLSSIIPIYRRDCQDEVYAGSHVYPGEGVYLLKFDNSYSLWRSKTLYYRVYYTR